MSQNPSNKNLEDKLDSIAEDVVVIRIMMAKQEVNLSRNTDSLEAHMKRTDLNEDRILKLENQLNKFLGAMVAISGFCAVIYALHSMGILGKLF